MVSFSAAVSRSQQIGVLKVGVVVVIVEWNLPITDKLVHYLLTAIWRLSFTW